MSAISNFYLSTYKPQGCPLDHPACSSECFRPLFDQISQKFDQLAQSQGLTKRYIKPLAKSLLKGVQTASFHMLLTASRLALIPFQVFSFVAASSVCAVFLITAPFFTGFEALARRIKGMPFDQFFIKLRNDTQMELRRRNLGWAR